MKKLIFSLVLIIPLFVAAAPIIRVVNNNGNWSSGSTWDLNRVPQTGDTVLVPLGKTVVITNNENIGGFLYVTIYGTVKMNGGKLDIGSTSIIMVNTGGKITGNGCSCEQIRIGGVKQYQGDPTVFGPQYATSTTSGFDPFSPLPVKFVSFTLTYTNKNVLVQWSTSEEMNAGMFEVERSMDGSTWNTVANVAASGTTSSFHQYSFTDKNISAHVVYYRIRETDLDGKFTFTEIRTLKTDVTAPTSIQMVPVQNQLMLQFSSEIKGNVMVQFISLSGQVVDQQMIRNPVGQVVLNSKVRGNYIVSISNDQALHIARQIIL